MSETVEKNLNVPYWKSKQSFYCSEASAQMFLDYYGYKLDQDYINRHADRFETLLPFLNKYVRTIKLIPNKSLIINSINNKNPVILCIHNKYLHTIVIIGYTANDFIIHDSDQRANMYIDQDKLLGISEKMILKREKMSEIKELEKKLADLKKQRDMYDKDVKAGEKIKGIVAELLTYDDKGKRVGSKLVFRPFCEYYVPKWNDEYAETEFMPDEFIKEFGEDVFKKVTDGEIIEAESTIGEHSIKKTCSIDRDFIKVKDKIIFPYAGKTERLVRKSIYLKIHPESKLQETHQEKESCPACEFAVGIGMYLNVCRDIDSEENCQDLSEKVTNGKITPEEFFNIIKEKAKDKPEKLDILGYIDELIISGTPLIFEEEWGQWWDGMDSSERKELSKKISVRSVDFSKLTEKEKEAIRSHAAKEGIL